jgi:hypothetical protein
MKYSQCFLYVIVQDPRGRDSRFENAVAIYEVSQDFLVFVPPLLEDKIYNN